MRGTIGTAEEITILIKYSSKRENILESTKEQIECEDNSDFQASKLTTFWSCQKHVGQYVQYVSKGLWITTICYGMSPKRPEENTELKSRIIGLKTQIESFHLLLVSILVTKFFPIPITYLKPYRLKKC